MKKSGLATFVHHDTPFEFCYDFDERVNYIKMNKKQEEQPLRLKLFMIVPEELIPGRELAGFIAYIKAWEACDKAQEAYYKTGESYDKAQEAYNKAKEACDKAQEAYFTEYKTELDGLLKKLYPDCPWNGKTIFTRKNEKGEWY